MNPARTAEPSRVLARLATTKKYPKPHPVPEAAAEAAWEVLSEDDPDVSVVGSDDREDQSEVRLLAAPPAIPAAPATPTILTLTAIPATPAIPAIPAIPAMSEIPVTEALVSSPPMGTTALSNSVFEALLSDEPASPRPPPPPAAPPPLVRSSARPTIPLGPPATMVLPAVMQSFDLRAPKIIDVTPAPPKKKHGWGTSVAIVAAFVAVGVAFVGGAHLGASTKSSSAPVDAPAHADPKVEPLAVEPSLVALSELPPPKPTTVPTVTTAYGPSRARVAMAEGDLDAAGAIFEELAENPATKMDGLAGLAEISRARGDLAGAQARYRDMLAEAPQYFPAKLGLADTTWDLGERSAARTQYQAIAATYPRRMTPSRVSDRAK